MNRSQFHPTRLVLLTTVLLLGTATGDRASAQTLREEMWIPNGQVYSVLATDSTVYIGGAFDRVSPPTGRAIAIDATTGQLAQTPPFVRGGITGLDSEASTVYAIAPDGAGGWYLGGEFTRLAGETRNFLAQIDSSGALTSWNPNCNAPVRTILVSGNTIYVGGEFSSVGVQSRSRIAAIDATTGLATSWNPGCVGVVHTLASYGGNIYVGGNFSSLGGQARSHIGAVSATTGLATAWNPGANLPVQAMALRLVVFPSTSATLYVGGSFSTIGGTARNALASFDITSGGVNTPTTWNPNVQHCPTSCAQGTVYAMNLNGTTLNIGGLFSIAGGAARANLAAINGSGVATSWAPSAPSIVYAMTRKDITLYVGGGSTADTSQFLRAYDLPSGNELNWYPDPNAAVRALGVAGNTVFAGGDFTGAFGVRRRYLAALNRATGQATPWRMDVGGQIYTMAARGSTIYLGGTFNAVGGQARSGLAALDGATGSLTSWNPNVSGVVYCVDFSPGTVYAGGIFNTVGGQTRSNIAAVDSATALPKPFDPNANGQVNAIAVDGAYIYAGGKFTNIGGFNRNRIAKLDALTGDAAAWSPNSNNEVRALAVSGSAVYAGGDFAFIGGEARNFLAALDPVTGLATEWNAFLDARVSRLALVGSDLYVGGSFTTIGGEDHPVLAILDPASAAPTSWTPSLHTYHSPFLGNLVSAISVHDGEVHIGGAFNAPAFPSHPAYAAFANATVAVDPTLQPGRLPLQAYPNPTRSEIWLRFATGQAAQVDAAVFDAAGRRVRTLHRGLLFAGEQQLRWDGRDGAGQRVAPGIYFVRVNAPGLQARTKLVRLP